MLKILGIVTLNTLGVVILGEYLFPDLGLEVDDKNQTMVLTILCMPSAFFIMDFLNSKNENQENSEKQGLIIKKGGK